MASTQITFEDNSLAQALFGEHGKHLVIVSRSLGVKHHARGHQVTLEGPEAAVRLAKRVLQELYGLLQLRLSGPGPGRAVHHQDSSGQRERFGQGYLPGHGLHLRHEAAHLPKSLNQKRYIEAIRAHDIVFGVGPAGTGKTYLAMAMAVAALVNNDVIRIVACPARGGGRGKARLPAGGPGGEGEPLSAASL